MKLRAVLFLSAAFSLCFFCVKPSQAQTQTEPEQSAQTGRIKIGSNYVSANGCHDTTSTFTTGIPDSDKLDKSYKGVLAGIEVVETTGVGTHAYKNFTFIANGSAITYQLYAKGAGYWQPPVCIFGTCIGGGACIGAKGASEGIDIYAHYLTTDKAWAIPGKQ